VQQVLNWSTTNESCNTNGRYDPAKVQAGAMTVTVLAGDSSNTFGALTVGADDPNDSLRIRVTGYDRPKNGF
jgi:hypothetical protein